MGLKHSLLRQGQKSHSIFDKELGQGLTSFVLAGHNNMPYLKSCSNTSVCGLLCWTQKIACPVNPALFSESASSADVKAALDHKEAMKPLSQSLKSRNKPAVSCVWDALVPRDHGTVLPGTLLHSNSSTRTRTLAAAGSKELLSAEIVQTDSGWIHQGKKVRSDVKMC